MYSPRTERKLQFKTARPEIFHLFIECAEKQSDVRVKFFQTFRFLFGLAVAYTEKRDYRRNVHNRKCFGVFVSDSSHRDKPLEDARMIINHSVYISFCVKLRKFGIAELLYRHHSAKSRNRFVMKRVCKNAPHLFRQCILGYFRKNGNVPVRLRDMNGHGVRRFVILCGCLVKQRVENCALASKMIVQRRGFYTDGFRDLPHADGIVAAGRKKFQRRGKNFLFGKYTPNPSSK